ncbi:MBL fold metallo-hydrolase [Flaviaesturariibacter amylovorans]|uniref:MBL fold metallo-hydrolase n=1 Tax=Flaviaesturariibacter amylovorans TaxID=1084520 RepID=A0ABP8GDC7_9BACT
MLTVQTFTFNPVQENTYLVYNEEGACCIIDPGCYFASEEKVLSDFITTSGLKPVLLLNTHCHLDHIFGNRFVQRTWGLELHLHRLEEPVLELGPASGQLWQLPFENYDGPRHFLDEGDAVRIGSDELHVLFTPGHSPGSITFYQPVQRFAIAGDVLFNGSVGRTDLPGGSFQLLEESIRTKLYTLPEDVIVYPGHGGSTTIGDERRDNPFVKMP